MWLRSTRRVENLNVVGLTIKILDQALSLSVTNTLAYSSAALVTKVKVEQHWHQGGVDGRALRGGAQESDDQHQVSAESWIQLLYPFPLTRVEC